jgi:hypothetical protein
VQAGTLKRVPLSAAQVLRDAKLVELVGVGKWSAVVDRFREGPWPTSTAVNLRELAVHYRDVVQQLERYAEEWQAEEEQAERELAEQDQVKAEVATG